jgi:predicted esterase
MDPARDSLVGALAAAEQASVTMGDAGARAAAQLTALAQHGFLDGFSTGCLVAAAVTAAAAVLTFVYLPAHPGSGAPESDEQPVNTSAL